MYLQNVCLCVNVNIREITLQVFKGCKNFKSLSNESLDIVKMKEV